MEIFWRHISKEFIQSELFRHGRNGNPEIVIFNVQLNINPAFNGKLGHQSLWQADSWEIVPLGCFCLILHGVTLYMF